MPAKTAIGFHFTPDCIKMVQLSRRSGRYCVDNATSVPFDGQAYQEPESRRALEAQIRQVVEEAGFDPKAAVVSDVPHGNVYYATLTTDLTREEDIRRLVQFELEDDVPIPFEDLAVDLSGHRHREDVTRCLVAAAHKSEVQSLREMLSAAQLTCSAVSTDVNAIEAIARSSQAIAGDDTAIIVHLESGRLIIGLVNEGCLLGARSLACAGAPEDCAEIVITDLDRTFRVHPIFLDAEASKVVLSACEEVTHSLAKAIEERFDLPVKPLDIESTFQQSTDMASNADYRVALGLALMQLSSSGATPNFIATALSEASLKKDVWRAGRVCAALVLLLVVLLGYQTISRIRALDGRNASLQKEIKAFFAEHVPEIPKIVQPLPQMTEQLDLARKDYQVLSQAVRKRALPLAVMQVVSKRMSVEDDLVISYMLLDHEIVRVFGTGKSYKSVEALAADLRVAPEFKDVELEDVSTNRGDGRVQFRLLISRTL